MPLGNKNEKNGKLLILKIKTQDAEKKSIEPTFEVREKIDGKWTVTDTTPAAEGNLNKIEVKEGEYEGQKTYNFSLYLKDTGDSDETYLIDLRSNMLSRGLLNSLLNLKKFDEVKLSLYTGKNGYPQVAIRQHGELIKWKYSLDELPKPEEVKFKGKIQRDYTEVEEFFVEKVKEFSNKVAEFSNKASGPSGPSEAASKIEIQYKQSKPKASQKSDMDFEIDKTFNIDEENDESLL